VAKNGAWEVEHLNDIRWMWVGCRELGP